MRYLTLGASQLFLIQIEPIVLNPNISKGNAIKIVPNLNLFDKLLENIFSGREHVFNKTIIVASVNPKKFHA